MTPKSNAISKEGIAEGIGLTFDEIILKVNPDAESDGESAEAR
jgi:hypothetical protein